MSANRNFRINSEKIPGEGWSYWVEKDLGKIETFGSMENPRSSRWQEVPGSLTWVRADAAKQLRRLNKSNIPDQRPGANNQKTS